MNFETQYLETVSHVLSGEVRPDRTGTGVRSVFRPSDISHVFDYDEEGKASFPLLTLKRVPWKSVIAETLWFLQGRTDLQSLREDGCTWWDEWELEDGTIGRGYGAQLRDWKGFNGSVVDQLQNLIEGLVLNPSSRRHIMTMWNPAELDQMALPPCHGVYIQCYVSSEGELDLHVHIRSSDLFLGLPTNIPSYALVQLIIAQVAGLRARRLNVTLGDAHLYNNHLQQSIEMLERDPKETPRIFMDPHVFEVDHFRPHHFNVVGYEPHPSIYAPVSV